MKTIWGIPVSVGSYLSAATLLICMAMAKPADAQAVYGSVWGTVMEASGAPLRNAAITVTSIEKGSQVRVVTNGSGYFTVTHLVPDTYNIKAEAVGYQTSEQVGVEVYADHDVTFNFPLQKGLGGGASPPATAPSSLLKTDRADVSTTLSLQELQDLPNFTRNFTSYELLVPGALPNSQEYVLRPEENPQQGQQIDQNGQHYSGSAFQLDGTDNRDPINGIIVINPALDSLSEMKVTSQNFDAEFGQALAGLVTAQSRSGSNNWHGSAFEYRNTEWGDALVPTSLLNNPNAALSPFKINDFGGSFGGPLVKNRLFFFSDYEGHRRIYDNTVYLPVPTQKVRDTCLTAGSTVCDLSDYLVPDPKTPAENDFAIYHPGTSTPFGPSGTCPGNCIPTSMLSPPAVNLLSLLPAPDTSISKASGNEVSPLSSYAATGAEPFNDDEFDVRIDHSVSSKLKLFGRYTFADYRIDANGSYGTEAGGFGLSTDGFAGSSRSRNQDISSGFNYLFSPTFNMDFRFGFYRYHLEVFQGGLGTTPATNAGIPGLNLGDQFSSGMPALTINDPAEAAGVIAFGYGQAQICANCPIFEHEQQFQWATNWGKLSGKHNIRWGADIRHAQNLLIEGERAGNLTFASSNTANASPAPGAPPSGLSLATFLLGNVTSFSRFIGSNYNAQERQNRFFFYGQDNWRLSPNLTLTYGLRWEIYAPQSVNAPGNGGFLDLATGMIDVAGEGPFNLHGNVQNSFTNFAPRVGFAYRALPHTAIRAAYGRSFDLGFAGAVFGDTVTQNLPVVGLEQLSGPTSATTQFTLSNGPTAFSLPNSSTGQFMLQSPFAANLLPAKVQIPRIDEWNLTVEQELNSTMFLELAYVANKGTHVFPESPNGLAITPQTGPQPGTQTAAYDINQATIQGFLVPCSTPNSTPSPTYSTSTTKICTSSTESREPYYPIYKWNQEILYFGNNASDNYESLQAKLVKRFKQGIQFRAAYTWSKSLAYSENYYAIEPGITYGPASFDRRQAFVFSNLWDLPIGKGRPLFGSANGVLDRVIGGWELNTATYVYSGLPFTPTYKDCSQDTDTGPCVPNIVGPVHITGNPSEYFTASPTALGPGVATINANGTVTTTVGQTYGPWQRPAGGTFGDAGYNSLRGPNYWDTDMALLKNFSLTESWRLQFRVDVENVFNRVNLGQPNPCVDCGTAAINNLASGANMRMFEFALKLQF